VYNQTPRSIQPYITPRYVNQIPAFLPGVKVERIHLCWVAGNTVWSHLAGDALQLCNGLPLTCVCVCCQLNHLTLMELNCVRPFLSAALDHMHLLRSNLAHTATTTDSWLLALLLMHLILFLSQHCIRKIKNFSQKTVYRLQHCFWHVVLFCGIFGTGTFFCTSYYCHLQLHFIITFSMLVCVMWLAENYNFSPSPVCHFTSEWFVSDLFKFYVRMIRQFDLVLLLPGLINPVCWTT